MWRKMPPEPSTAPIDSVPPEPVLPAPDNQPAKRARIGRGIFFQGEVSGEQDLRIDGRFKGNISLPGHTLTVSRYGRVQGDLHAQTIQIEGTVEGGLWGEKRILLQKTGCVRGDLTSPRIVLEEGCQFRGRVTMTTEGELSAEGPES